MEAAETAEVDWEEVVREAVAEVAMGEAAVEVAMVKVEASMEQARDSEASVVMKVTVKEGQSSHRPPPTLGRAGSKGLLLAESA